MKSCCLAWDSVRGTRAPYERISNYKWRGCRGEVRNAQWTATNLAQRNGFRNVRGTGCPTPFCRGPGGARLLSGATLGCRALFGATHAEDPAHGLTRTVAHRVGPVFAGEMRDIAR